MANKGNCYLCGAELGKVAMKNHILKHHNAEDGKQECRLFKVEGAYDKDYWLYVDIPVDKSLSVLDSFLRKIWLECCGHLSQFSGAGKSSKLGRFPDGYQFLHEYDMGDTTETLITVVGTTRRPPRREAVRLLARNVPPKFQCGKCGAAADSICPICLCEGEYPFFCAACAEKHEHWEMLLPVVNSPRMGVCGYCGELDTYGFVPPESGGGAP